MPKIPKDLEYYYKASAHWRKGKELNYPECCIKHFIWITEILRIKAPVRLMDAVYGQSDVNYVQCPKCRIKKLIAEEK